MTISETNTIMYVLGLSGFNKFLIPFESKIQVNIFVLVKKLNFKVINCSIPNVVIVFLMDFSVSIVNVYRPPSNSADNNEVLMLVLQVYCTGKKVIIQEHFILPCIPWNGYTHLLSLTLYPILRKSSMTYLP